jgi:uncharacterized membrane protein YeiH
VYSAGVQRFSGPGLYGEGRVSNRESGSRVLLVVDLLATLLVALEGGGAAVLGHLDLLGILVLSFVSALGGGIVRDLLLGSLPPNALRDWRYGTVALSGGALIILGFGLMTRFPEMPLTMMDAAGLSLFAVAGADKAMEFHVSPLAAVLLGGITGCGGGVIRDVLLMHVPRILHADLYATAALLGALLTVLLLRARMHRGWAMALGAVACFALRMTAVFRHWSIPHLSGY